MTRRLRRVKGTRKANSGTLKAVSYLPTWACACGKGVTHIRRQPQPTSKPASIGRIPVDHKILQPCNQAGRCTPYLPDVARVRFLGRASSELHRHMQTLQGLGGRTVRGQKDGRAMWQPGLLPGLWLLGYLLLALASARTCSEWKNVAYSVTQPRTSR